ncbi:MAG TPA: serine/threonine-protein kinase [Cyanophyceae cyanobacterium]
MSLCINPSCPKPTAPENDRNLFCIGCGSELVLQGRYRVMRLLSDKSGFGKIYDAYEGTTPKILKVLKEELNHDAKAVELFEKEAIVLGQLHHPGIPNVDGYFPFQTRSSLTLHCLVMERIDGPNLEQWLEQQQNRPISQEQAIAWLKQLAVILKLVHDKHYLHRDIKPSNVMLRPDGQLVLIDFGTAREMTRTYLAKKSAGQAVTAIISAGYTAPEQMNGDASPASDFFSLGRTFVFLLTGRHPNTMYDSQNDVLRWRNHTSGISPGLLNLIDEMMARNPSDRPANSEEILQCLDEIEHDLNQTVNVVGIPQSPMPGGGTSQVETVNVVGITPQTTTLSPQVPQPEEEDDKWPLILITALFLLGLLLMGLTALAVFKSNLVSLPTPTQTPQRQGGVDYFPYVEGTDSQGRTAEFNIAVLSVEYKWKIGSSYQIQYNDQTINLDSLQSRLEQEGIRRIMENPNEIISVGTASCEGSTVLEERRALERSKQIQLLVKRLFSNVPTVQGYRLLNLGQFKREGCEANQDLTSYQRSIIIIGVKKQSEGVILDEALRNRLEKKPFGDFKLDDYSLGSSDKFRTIPSQL